MEQEKRARLEAAGIDVTEALGRFMGNEGLLMKFLLRFSQDPSFAKLEQSLGAGDAEGAYEAAHALKGVAGNLAMKPLYDQACAVMAPLRAGDLAGGRAGMAELERRYRQVLAALGAG